MILAGPSAGWLLNLDCFQCSGDLAIMEMQSCNRFDSHLVMQQGRPLNFHQLEVFRAVARVLNFSRAAEELYISQPAVSRHVKELEKALGVPLFHREGRRVQLNDAGRVVYDYADRAFVLREELQRALAELQGPGRGYLRLAATDVPAAYLLPRGLAAFQDRYPEVHVSLAVSDMAMVTRQAVQHQVDVGVIDCPATPADVQWQPLAIVPVVVVASPGHPLASSGSVDASHLSHERIIVERKGSATREVMERHLETVGVQAAKTIEIDGVEPIKQAVAANLGLAFLPLNCVAPELDRGELLRLNAPGLSAEIQVGIITAKGRRLPATALTFMAVLHKTRGNVTEAICGT